jgi:DNA-binding transcriptional ArsR family regulator
MSKRSKSAKAGESAGRAVESETLDAVFGALAHAARRQILIVLHARGGEMTAGEINDRFQHSWPTTTRHLQVLESAGLLDVKSGGRNRFYALTRTDLVRATEWLNRWVRDTGEPGKKRSSWADLPYATMRNVIPPVEKAARAPKKTRK